MSTYAHPYAAQTQQYAYGYQNPYYGQQQQQASSAYYQQQQAAAAYYQTQPKLQPVEQPFPSLAGSIIPGLKRQDTARSSTDEGPSKDAIAPKDSPSPSVASEPVVGKPKGSKIRKEKKDKRKSMGPA